MLAGNSVTPADLLNAQCDGLVGHDETEPSVTVDSGSPDV
jgi:hypothetical protein